MWGKRGYFWRPSGIPAFLKTGGNYAPKPPGFVLTKKDLFFPDIPVFRLVYTHVWTGNLGLMNKVMRMELILIVSPE